MVTSRKRIAAFEQFAGMVIVGAGVLISGNTVEVAGIHPIIVGANVTVTKFCCGAGFSVSSGIEIQDARNVKAKIAARVFIIIRF